MAQELIIDGQIWTKDRIKQTIQESDKALYTALLKVYERQTADEQRAETTKYINGEGFSAIDADILSSFAKQLLMQRTQGKQLFLTPKQVACARKNMVKYAGQLFQMLVNKYSTKQ